MNKKIALYTLLTFCNMHAASDEEFAKAMLASVFGLRTPSIERRLQALENFGIVLPIAVDAAIKKTTESAEIIRRLQVENAEFRTQQTRTDI